MSQSQLTGRRSMKQALTETYDHTVLWWLVIRSALTCLSITHSLYPNLAPHPLTVAFLRFTVLTTSLIHSFTNTLTHHMPSGLPLTFLLPPWFHDKITIVTITYTAAIGPRNCLYPEHLHIFGYLDLNTRTQLLPCHPLTKSRPR